MKPSQTEFRKLLLESLINPREPGKMAIILDAKNPAYFVQRAMEELRKPLTNEVLTLAITLLAAAKMERASFVKEVEPKKPRFNAAKIVNEILAAGRGFNQLKLADNDYWVLDDWKLNGRQYDAVKAVWCMMVKEYVDAIMKTPFRLNDFVSMGKHVQPMDRPLEPKLPTGFKVPVPMWRSVAEEVRAQVDAEA